jgi:hypothetical protein
MTDDVFLERPERRITPILTEYLKRCFQTEVKLRQKRQKRKKRWKRQKG